MRSHRATTPECDFFIDLDFVQIPRVIRASQRRSTRKDRLMRRTSTIAASVTLAISLLAAAACTRHPGAATGPQRTSPAVEAAGGANAPVNPQAFGGANGGPAAAAPNVRTAPAASGPAHAAANADDHAIGGGTALGNLATRRARTPTSTRSRLRRTARRPCSRVRPASRAPRRESRSAPTSPRNSRSFGATGVGDAASERLASPLLDGS